VNDLTQLASNPIETGKNHEYYPTAGKSIGTLSKSPSETLDRSPLGGSKSVQFVPHFLDDKNTMEDSTELNSIGNHIDAGNNEESCNKNALQLRKEVLSRLQPPKMIQRKNSDANLHSNFLTPAEVYLPVQKKEFSELYSKSRSTSTSSGDHTTATGVPTALPDNPEDTDILIELILQSLEKTFKERLIQGYRLTQPEGGRSCASGSSSSSSRSIL